MTSRPYAYYNDSDKFCVQWLENIEGTAARRGRQYRAQWRLKPGLPIVAHGIPARVGKLRAAGNAIIPQVAAEFIQAYAEALGLRL
jgi:hypothetical protein